MLRQRATAPASDLAQSSGRGASRAFWTIHSPFRAGWAVQWPPAPRAPTRISSAMPATGAYPNFRSFLNMELFKAEHFGAIGTTLQAGGKIVDGVLGQASSTFGQVCRASRPCAPNRAESRLAFFA